MLKLVRTVAVVSMICGLCAPSLAQGPTNSTTVPSTASKAEVDYMNQVVCQKQEVTGSRLTAKKICKTRSQWADQQLQDRQEIERVQTQRSVKTP
jgi:hypothetical protein